MFDVLVLALILSGTMYGSEQCHHDVDSFLAGGTRLLRVEHSDQMIALFDGDQELEVELGKIYKTLAVIYFILLVSCLYFVSVSRVLSLKLIFLTKVCRFEYRSWAVFKSLRGPSLEPSAS